MSERTFRAVVAAVLVGALALAAVAVVALLPRSNEPLPTAPPSTGTGAGPTLTVAPTPTAGPVFIAPDIVSVGLISRGASSGTTLELRFLEPRADAIANAPGSFRVTLTDRDRDGTTVAFVGVPSVSAPDTLGATASLAAPNVLMVSIVSSDTEIQELITIRGLGIRASSTAAVGPVRAELNAFAGSLALGVADSILPAPGSVVAGP